MPGYNYSDPNEVDQASDLESAVRKTVIHYFHDQLGWTEERCEQRVEKELSREIPKGIFDALEEDRDWMFEGASVLDVGCGQGGAVLEALIRGSDAYGVEPGREFAELSRRRLAASGFDPERIRMTGGESLPFPKKHFDYVISLQVLEHVEDPEPILEEIYRVLKPGGEAHIRCENYLAFREQHYRVPWFPLLPKSIGSIYLRLIGRDPSFMKKYIFYTTYPQVWWISSKVGFENNTYNERMHKVETMSGIESPASKAAGLVLNTFPVAIRRKIALLGTHLSNAMKVGMSLYLRKPHEESENM